MKAARDIFSALAFVACVVLADNPSRSGALQGFLLGLALLALDLRYDRRGDA